MHKILAAYLLAAILVGCSTTYSIQIHEPRNNSGSIKQLALFLDGTQNDMDSRTNVSALSEIVRYQDKDNLYIFYNEGVGTDGKIIGAGTGWGIEKDVAEAYAFLTEYYSPGSKLYIFGFSRGAYTSRILAGMIYSVGIYDLKAFKKSDRIKIANELYYSAYKGKHKRVDDIRSAADHILAEWKERLDESALIDGGINRYEDVEIDIMGLWDTVEALGVIPTAEAVERKVAGIEDPQNIVNPNERYIDQICNIKHVYHALSLDDNRAYVFTPIIISSKYVASRCATAEQSSIDKVDEVWFSGAHADVGGGYDKNDNNRKDDCRDRDVSISGVSLNWMMSKIMQDAPELLPRNARVFENPLGYVHDAENGSFMYAFALRHEILDKYKKESRYGKLRIHSSVFQRLAKTGEERKQMGFDSAWYTRDEFRDCFSNKVNGSYVFKKCDAIEEVSNN